MALGRPSLFEGGIGKAYPEAVAFVYFSVNHQWVHLGTECIAMLLYATSWKVVGSIPNEVTEFFQFTKSFQLHYGSGVYLASNRNE
jgi:hypothetical protein